MLDAAQIGKWIFVAGLGVAGLGLVVWLVGRAGIPVGHLPGDVRVDRPGWSFTFPIVTCILISIVATIVLNVLARVLHK
jgi:hypothetical protein